jgi:hypothetical protein
MTTMGPIQELDPLQTSIFLFSPPNFLCLCVQKPKNTPLQRVQDTLNATSMSRSLLILAKWV